MTCSLALPFAETLLPRDNDTFEWSTSISVQAVRGNLADVATYTIFDDKLLLDTTQLDVSDDDPGSGQGMYYVIKYAACGSWQTALSAEPPRDVTLP